MKIKKGNVSKPYSLIQEGTVRYQWLTYQELTICYAVILILMHIFSFGRILTSRAQLFKTPLVNVSLKFQMLISQIHQHFLLKKCEKLLQCKSFSHFCNKKFQCIWL